MYAPYDAEIDFLQDQISVLSDEIAERDRHIETLKSERVSSGYEPGFPGRGSRGGSRGGSRASSIAPSEDGADRDVELQVRVCVKSRHKLLCHGLAPCHLHRVHHFVGMRVHLQVFMSSSIKRIAGKQVEVHQQRRCTRAPLQTCTHGSVPLTSSLSGT